MTYKMLRLSRCYYDEKPTGGKEPSGKNEGRLVNPN